MLMLVDGYNITKSDPATRDLSLEEQREALVGRLRVRGRDLLGSGRIVVVFDAQGGAGDSFAREGGVEVRYSRAGTADDSIVQLAKGERGKIVLVSSDRTLAERTRVHARGGCEVRPREVLFAEARPKKRAAPRRYPAASTGIPKGGNSITEELKKIWLEDEE
ncbi:MAG: NYN domain-containing protein [Coriobacteriia bacterium]|nr:NYN domain-containing protein [Coriobacteriia bacterium]MBN2821577.1 NYN domain-containing protein [Coriobacteriia bacterium]